MKIFRHAGVAVWSTMFLTVLFILIAPCIGMLHGKSWTGYEENPFYYSEGRKIPLTRSTELVAVRPRQQGGGYSLSSRHPALQGQVSEEAEMPGGFALMRLKPGLTHDEVKQLSSDLGSDASVDSVAPAFTAPGAHMLAPDNFIAQFTPSMRAEDISALNALYAVEIVKQLEWSQNTWVLRAPPGKVIDTANTYHDHTGVVYAHPDFIRVMPKNPGPGPTATASGPSGSGSAVVQSTSMALPASSAPTKLAASPQASVSGGSVKTESFESGFPGNWSTVGSPTWGRSAYRAYSGSWSAYCVGSGSYSRYLNNMSIAMIYGPFSLADARDARIALQAWILTEARRDNFSVMASTDGANFYGSSFSGDYTGNGDGGWVNIAMDLKNVYRLGDLRGLANVWVALAFSTDSDDVYEGVYVDDLDVEKITGGYETITSDPYSHLQWALSNNGQLWGTSGVDVQADEAWAVGSANASPVIAIIDEGVDLAHPDLINKLAPGYDAMGLGSAGAPSGDDAHGTNCAGIAAAEADNGLGIAGVARSARIMPVRIAYGNAQGYWVTTDSMVADGIVWAVDNGADVLSNSWGGGSPSDAITNAVNYAKTNGRQGKGAVVVFAAGNENGSITYPATIADVLAVGALSPCGERKSPSSCDGEYWWGGNYGRELDITAPGVLMYATDIAGSRGYDSGDYYASFNGTSSATPVVAGVAALVLGVNPNLTAGEVESILMSTARDLMTSGWDEETGYGLVNAYQAALLAASGAAPPPVADFGAVPSSGTAPLTVSFTDSSSGDVTSWSWDFGDGSYDSTQNPVHTYTASGLYNVTLSVSGPGGADTKTKTGFIDASGLATASSPPVAGFTADAPAGAAPHTVSFTDNSAGTIYNWSWDFGDGYVSTSPNPSHTYTESGVYTLRLTVSGPGGSDAVSAADYVRISPSGPTVWQDWFAVDPRETPMTGDFNGDGLCDIITFTRDNPNAVGDVYVALSDGTQFGDNTFWNDWFAVSPDETVVIGDFNGDGMDDIATRLGKSTKQVYVSLSYGYGMDAASVWLSSLGEGDADVLHAADVNADGKEDLILFARSSGRVLVALSNGTGLAGPEVWHNWFAVSAYERPEVGDLDGDGRADIITFCSDSPTARGDVYIALSTGAMFGDGVNSEKWNDWFAVNPSEIVRTGDLDGDGQSDLLTFLPAPAAQVYAVYSEGGYLSDNHLQADNFRTSSTDAPYVGDVNGDGKADLILFRQSEGKVYVTVSR
jgi:PKD repeat protein